MLHEEHTPMCNCASDNDTFHIYAVCACCGACAFTDKARIYLHYYHPTNKSKNTPALTIHSLTRAFIFQNIPNSKAFPGWYAVRETKEGV